MTKIEWTQATWNPIVGCSIVSPGCTNCYAMKIAARLEAMSVANETRTGGDPGPLFYYRGLTQDTRAGAVWTGKVRLAPEDVLTKPVRWRKPRMVFVNSMSDLFHEDVPDEWIDRVFAVMALCPQHTFQVLTKRSARMRRYITELVEDQTGGRMESLCDAAVALTQSPCAAHIEDVTLPLPNVWFGVSAERQQEADQRIPDLLATPAVVRFVSAEPLIGPIDFTAIPRKSADGFLRPLDGRFNRLDWIIVGGESGPGARPMHPDWARSIRDQCAAAGVSFFFKQWGSWAWSDDGVTYTDAATSWGNARFPKGTKFVHHSCGRTAFRVGKSRAGRLLDGRKHNDLPGTEVR